MSVLGRRSPNASCRTRPWRNSALSAADRIEQKLFREALPIGSLIGSVETLAHQHRLGRESVREAIRVLQFRGTISTRRGPHGGLVIASPTLGQVTRALLVRLTLADVGLDSVRRGRLILALAAARMISQRTEGLDALLRGADRQIADWGIEPAETLGPRARFSLILSAATGNVALTFFALTLSGFVDAQGRIDTAGSNTERDRLLALEAAIFATLRRRDAAGAYRLLESYHKCVDAQLKSVVNEPTNPGVVHREMLLNRSHRLARQIVRSIFAKGYRPGDRLGSEAALRSEHSAPHATFRQALRILEADGIIEFRVGRGLGVFIKAPDLSASVPRLQHCLRSRGLDARSAEAVRLAMRLELTQRGEQAEAQSSDPILGLLENVLA